jgi:hypothetical protein
MDDCQKIKRCMLKEIATVNLKCKLLVLVVIVEWHLDAIGLCNDASNF